jgi:hypothetical protein
MNADKVLRIGDAEREAAVTAIGEHYAAGRLDRDELEERIEAAWRARTRADLAVLFTDLPTARQAAHPAVPGQQPGHQPGFQPARREWLPRGLPVRLLMLVLLAVILVSSWPWLLLLIPLLWLAFLRMMFLRFVGGRMRGRYPTWR